MGTYTINEDTFKLWIRDTNIPEAKQYTSARGFFRSIDNISLNNLRFESTEVYENIITLDKCTFKKIDFEGASFKNFLWFKNCIFEDDVRFYDGTFESIMFENCEFTTGLTAYNIKAKKLSFEDCIAKNHFKIRGGVISNLKYISTNEKSHLKIDGYFTFINFLSLDTIIGSTVSASQSTINLLKIKGDYNSSSRINLSEIRNFEISLDNINNDGKFYFTHFKIGNYKLKIAPALENLINMIEDNSVKSEILDFLKYKNNITSFLDLANNFYLKSDLKKYLYFRFYNEIVSNSEEANANFTIKHCSMGSLELKNIDFKKYDPIIMSSDLSSVKLINTSFPTTHKARTASDGFTTFIDLYTSANRQNNISDKVEYYKAAQEYLYKKIKLQPKSIQRSGSLTAIRISNFYSSHGSNWIKAVVKTVFLIGLPLFFCFTASLSDLTLNISSDGVNYYFSKILPYFPEFLNPLHRIDFMSKISANGGWSSLIDLLARIFVGIGIFEMVRSFRKYVRT